MQVFNQKMTPIDSVSQIDKLDSSMSDDKDLDHVYEPIEDVENIDTKYSQNDYCKRGFYAAISEKFDHERILRDINNSIDDRWKKHIADKEVQYKIRENNFIDKIDIISSKIVALEKKLNEYEIKLHELSKEKTEINLKLKDLQILLLDIAKSIGNEKHGIIEKRLFELNTEFESILNVYHNIENKQNERYFEKNKKINQDRIDFLLNVKKDYQFSFDNVKKRIQYFDKIGVNLVLSNTLVSIGILGTVIGGWFFSIWTGPKVEQTADGNIVNNSSTLFFVVDQFTRFTLRYTRQELAMGVLFFFIIMYTISFICYKLLIHFKFIKDPSEENNQNTTENEFELDIMNEEDFFKSQFKGSNWFSFWLKITPFLVFTTILLSILGRVSIYTENKALNTKEKDKLQEMFDSLINQNFGSMISILIAGILFLYIVKVIEPRHSKVIDSNDEGLAEKVSDNWELISALLLFLFVLIPMLSFKSRVSFITDQRKIYLIAFVITSISAGFCLGYGLIYRELISNYESLEKQIFKLVDFIFRLSKPISYLENQNFQSRISNLQKKMIDLIEKRNNLTLKIIDNSDDDQLNSQNSIFDNLIKSPFKYSRIFLFQLWQISLPFWKKIFSLMRSKIENNNNDALFTNEEKAYYPEIVYKVDYIQSEINKFNKRLAEINKQEDGYWREEGTYRIIQNQINRHQSTIYQVKKSIDKDLLDKLKSISVMNDICNKQKDLILKGFNTGIWYLKHGEDLRDYILTPNNK